MAGILSSFGRCGTASQARSGPGPDPGFHPDPPSRSTSRLPPSTGAIQRRPRQDDRKRDHPSPDAGPQRRSRPGARPKPGTSVGPRTLEAFARMTLSSEAHTLTAYVEALIKAGLSLEDRLRRSAHPDGAAARRRVERGLHLFHRRHRRSQPAAAGGAQFRWGTTIPTRDADGDAPSAYFVPAPNEQHVFGLVILEDYFRRAGWRTWLDTAATLRGGGANGKPRLVRHLRPQRHVRHADSR